MAKFVVFAKRVEPLEARLRVFCMTDDKEEKTLEYQEHFTEVAKSRDVEVLEGKPQYTEFAGNLVPVTKSGEQLHIQFKAFRENRLPFNVRVKDQHADTVGRALFMREPRVAKGEQPQQPICILNIVLPEEIYAESSEDRSDLKRFTELSSFYRTGIDRSNLSDIRIVDISNLLGEDWIRLAPEIGITEEEVSEIIAENPTSTPRQAQSMLQNYILRKDSNRTVLETSLRSIKRDDIIKKCLRLSSYMEKPRQPAATSSRKGTSLDNGYEETDHMKDSESVEELAAREREELKYSAEEKIVEDSDGEEEEGGAVVKRSVAERREQITKRLSIERPIPASTQQKEIVQEVVELKRRSLIEDKKAMHEEEIIMHAPTDNIIKSATIPEPVIKLKSGKKEEIDVSKSDFDKELQDKFKTTIKDVESFEHQMTEEFKATAPPPIRLDEKVQLDSAVTEKPFKEDKDTFVVSTAKTETTTAPIPQDAREHIDVTKKFLEQESLEGPVSSIEQPQPKVQRTPSASKIPSRIPQKTADLREHIDVTKKFLEQESYEGPVGTAEQQPKVVKRETVSATAQIPQEPVDLREHVDVTRKFLEQESYEEPVAIVEQQPPKVQRTPSASKIPSRIQQETGDPREHIDVTRQFLQQESIEGPVTIIEQQQPKVERHETVTATPTGITKTTTITAQIPQESGDMLEHVEVARKFLEQEGFEGPVSIIDVHQHQQQQPTVERYETITTITGDTTSSTKNFLDNEVAAHGEPVTTVTKNVTEHQEGPVRTITTRTTTTTSREWSEPIELDAEALKAFEDGNHVVHTTVRITKDVLPTDNDDEFYKTIQEKITKKMSQDFTTHKDDIIADGEYSF